MKIIDRYLIREMAGPFLFGVLAFVLLFVSANILFQLTQLVSEYGLGLLAATELFFLWLPGFIIYTIPLATLVAILVAFGRLSGDSELVAMYAGGISFRRLVVPFAAAGLLLSLVTAGINELLVPAANHRAAAVVQAAMERAGKVTQQNVLYRETSGDDLSQIIYADDFNLKTGLLTNPTTVWFVKGRPVMVTEAKRAQWEQNKWIMYDGTNTTPTTQPPTTVSFPKWTADIPTTPQALAERSLSPEEMTYSKLKERIRLALERHEPTIELELSLHHKFSIPFACLVFALVAPALGARSHRGSSSIGMGIAILIGFGYYVVWHYLSAVAQQGHLTPFWAAWLPNIVTAAVGLGLIFSVRK